jgi:hypothetical protein
MKGLIFWFFIVLCFLNSTSFGQGYALKGQVVEDDERPVYGAQVFLNGTSRSVVSDKTGRFSITGLAAGSYELVVSLLGYKPYSRQIRIEKENVELRVTLHFNPTALKEVVIQPDLHRAENFEIFKKHFLGESGNARQCRILNPEVLNLIYDQKERAMEADSGGEFLIIENRALGYQVKYLLTDFRLHFPTGMLTYLGKTVFEDLKGSRARINRWHRSRERAYLGSAQHFLASVFNGTVYKEGYEIQKLIRTPNSERPSDSVIASNIRRFSRVENGVVIQGNNDSVNYWVNKRKLPKVIQYLIKGRVSTDSLLTTVTDNMKELRFEDCLYVIYTGEREPPEFNVWNGTIPKPLDQPNFQVSVITRNIGSLEIDRQGNLADPMAVFYEGYWAFEKVGDMVPSDYIRPL